jgi:hypothetical protein
MPVSISTTYVGLVVITGPIGVVIVNGLLFTTTLCVTVENGEKGESGAIGDKGSLVIERGVKGDNTVDELYGVLNIVDTGTYAIIIYIIIIYKKIIFYLIKDFFIFPII